LNLFDYADAPFLPRVRVDPVRLGPLAPVEFVSRAAPVRQPFLGFGGGRVPAVCAARGELGLVL
jgi:hypothetical protein